MVRFSQFNYSLSSLQSWRDQTYQGCNKTDCRQNLLKHHSLLNCSARWVSGFRSVCSRSSSSLPTKPNCPVRGLKPSCLFQRFYTGWPAPAQHNTTQQPPPVRPGHPELEMYFARVETVSPADLSRLRTPRAGSRVTDFPPAAPGPETLSCFLFRYFAAVTEY